VLLNLRGVVSNGSQVVGSDAAPGTFANIRGLQFVTDFILTFAIAVSIEQMLDVFRKRFSSVRFRYLKAPVAREFCDFVPHEIRHTAKDPISAIGAVFEADDEEAEDPNSPTPFGVTSPDLSLSPIVTPVSTVNHTHNSLRLQAITPLSSFTRDEDASRTADM
jgi:hypothetical protein